MTLDRRYGSAFGKRVDKLGGRALSLAVRAAERANREVFFALKRLKILQVRALYEGFPDDIFIVSYPKSGTTWVQMILYQLMTSGEMNFPHIDCVSPHLEETLL